MRAGLVLVPVLVVGAACAGTVQPEGVPAFGSGSLTLVDLEPSDGSQVDATTVIRATLQYMLPADAPGSYFVAPQFATSTEGRTIGFEVHDVFLASGALSPTTTTRGRGQTLEDPEGQVSIELPMRIALNNEEVARPIRMWFYLNYRIGRGQSRVIAHEGPVRFEVDNE